MDPKTLLPMKASPLDDDAFRLLALPYGGPIPFPGAPRGVDMDRQWFSEASDFGDVPTRMDVDWHHGGDSKFGRTVIGKAGDLEFEEDGGWITVWLDRQQRKLRLVERLAAKGAQIFGSSEAVLGSGRLRILGKADVVPWYRNVPGEIVRWHYFRQTLSPDPINTLSVLQPLKATLTDISAGTVEPTSAFFDDLARFIDNLQTGPAADPTGEAAAKAGRVLSAKNEAALRKAIDEMSAVLAQLDRYVHEDATG